MQRVRFESMVKSLLPAVTDRAVDTWVQYAQELDHEEVEAESDFFDAAYVELMLIKQHHGEDIATNLFNYGEVFPFNYFELRGAANKLKAGWPLEKISQYTVENGCDPTAEEFEESQSALWAFKLSEQESTEIQMM